MKIFSLNQMMPKLLKLNKRQKNQLRNKEKQKLNIVNNQKNQRKKNSQQKLLILKLAEQIKIKEIDYSKKRVRKEVLDEMRYNYLKSVRKYMNQ